MFSFINISQVIGSEGWVFGTSQEIVWDVVVQNDVECHLSMVRLTLCRFVFWFQSLYKSQIRELKEEVEEKTKDCNDLDVKQKALETEK